VSTRCEEDCKREGWGRDEVNPSSRAVPSRKIGGARKLIEFKDRGLREGHERRKNERTNLRRNNRINSLMQGLADWATSQPDVRRGVRQRKNVCTTTFLNR